MFINTLTNTGDTLATMSPENQKKLWAATADMFESGKDPFMALEGGPEAVVETITNTSKGAGHTITFPILSRFHGEGKLGEERFLSATDYERLVIGSNSLTVDFVRNASNESIRTEEHMGMRGELLNRVPELLGEWMGNKKSEHLQMEILHRTNSENHVIAGNRTSVHDLLSTDTLAWDEIVDMGALMRPMGGLHAVVGTDEGGNPIFGDVVIATVSAMQSLKKDSTYKQNLREAGERGAKNRLFAGGVVMLDGHAIKEQNIVDHADDGPIGSPLQPKARLGVAITAGTGTFMIKGGGNATAAALTQIFYFKHFPKFAYRFLVTDILATSANFWELNGDGNYYVAIINPRNAPVDPDKGGFYEISANDGNQLTVAKRLGPTHTAGTGVIQNSTVGGITYDANKHTQVHPANALIYLATNDGLPLMCTPMLGQKALRRGYGMLRNARMRDEDEGGFGKYTYICSVFGQAVRKDRSGRVPGIVLLKHTGPIEGWNIFVKTS